MQSYLIMVLLSFIIGTTTWSQNITDAVRYSQYDALGSARTAGVGGSFGAMGGDYSVTSINPAGLGTFFKNQFTITPSLGYSSSEEVRNGNEGSSSRVSSFGFDNISYVKSQVNIHSNWLTKNWAIGFTKLKSLKNNFSFNRLGVGSITERWSELAQGLEVGELDLFETGPAYDAGVLIEGDNNFYDTDYLLDDIVNKNQDVVETGQVSELSFAYALSYKNKLNIGISLGIPFLSFEQSKDYRESVNSLDENGELNFSNSLRFEENLSTTGSGINIKLGALYNMKFLRFGIAVHTATWYTLEDTYDTVVDYEYEYFGDNADMGSTRAEGGEGFFRYNFKTPWRFIASVGSIFTYGDFKGFVNVDAESINYSQASFNLTDGNTNIDDIQYERELNNLVNQELRNAMVYRIGAEIGYKGMRIRGGYAKKDDAEKYKNENSVGDIISYSFGFGVTFGDVFLDMAYQKTMNDGNLYYPYLSSDASRDPIVRLDNIFERYLLTIGVNF